MAESTTQITDNKPTPENPPVVVSARGVSLADRLRLNELPLATTPGGKSFCLKALHPSEHTIKAARVPGGNANSVAICSDMITTVPITDPNVSVTISQWANPVVPASLHYTDSGGFQRYTFLNAAFGGSVRKDCTTAQTQALVAMMQNSVSDYRITSQSVTAELIAPALADQGTITAAQYHVAPRTAEYYWLNATRDTAAFQPDIQEYPDLMAGSALVLGTSAYTSKARDGVYQPLKLTSFKWRNFTDRAAFFQSGSGVISPYNTTMTTAQPISFPYCEARNSGDLLSDCAIPKPCGNNVGIVLFSGLAANVAIRVRVRQVVEITARPSSTYAPLLETALPPDDIAMRMYQEISAKLMDGYPASYNDLGTLFEKIKSIGKAVLPYVDPALDILSKVPVIGPVASAAKAAVPVAKTAVKAVKLIAGAKKKSAKAATQSTQK